MNLLLINNWNGRLGNNILQIIRAIHFAKIKQYNCILFVHNLFITNKIIVDNTKYNDKPNIQDSFFNIKNLGVNDPSPKQMKDYFDLYIRNIFKIKYIDTENEDNNLYIHIRSGDIFSQNGGHSYYVQPPLNYYKNIILEKKWEKIFIIYEDDKNPCVNSLKKLKKDNIYFISSTLENDLKILSRSKNLVIGFGTFGLIIYFLAKNIDSLYLPKYVLEEMPQGDWGININIIDLPNYIKCGTWKNTKEQQNIMLNYKVN